MSARHFGVGDEVYVERVIPIAPGSLLKIQPGDAGIVEQVGAHFLSLRIHGIQIIVSKDDVVRASGAGAPSSDALL